MTNSEFDAALMHIIIEGTSAQISPDGETSGVAIETDVINKIKQVFLDDGWAKERRISAAEAAAMEQSNA